MLASKVSSPALLGHAAFTGTKLVALPARSRVKSSRRLRVAATQEFSSNWLNKKPIVPVLGFLGWTLPASIPVSALGGNSLFGLFLATIGEQLSRFPKGPPLDDKFWLYFTVYHVGLFTTLLLGQIGVNGREQGYWS